MSRAVVRRQPRQRLDKNGERIVVTITHVPSDGLWYTTGESARIAWRVCGTGSWLDRYHVIHLAELEGLGYKIKEVDD